MKITAYHPTYRKLQKLAKQETDTEQLKRYQVVMAIARKLPKTAVAQLVNVARSSVYRIWDAFDTEGIIGLRDRRSEREPVKVTDEFMSRLEECVSGSPRTFGWQRSTWTRELLAKQLCTDTKISLHETHIGRLLHQMNMRWGRARPVAKRLLNKRQKAGKMRKIKALLRNIPRKDVVLYQDEVDIHLNPKIGTAWMPRGKQLLVETPGKNQKRYIFGGLNAQTGQVTYSIAERKTAASFVDWLRVIAKRYSAADCIHIICDNYVIHKTAKVKEALTKLGRIVLHFLPVYSPEENRIELLWKQLHAAVTRNHQRNNMDLLMADVLIFLNALRRHGWRAQRDYAVAFT